MTFAVSFAVPCRHNADCRMGGGGCGGGREFPRRLRKGGMICRRTPRYLPGTITLQPCQTNADFGITRT